MPKPLTGKQEGPTIFRYSLASATKNSPAKTAQVQILQGYSWQTGRIPEVVQAKFFFFNLRERHLFLIFFAHLASAIASGSGALNLGVRCPHFGAILGERGAKWSKRVPYRVVNHTHTKLNICLMRANTERIPVL